MTPGEIHAPETCFHNPEGHFLGNHISGENLMPLPLADHDPAWIFLVIMACAGLFAFLQLFYPHRLKMVLRGAFARNYANQLIRTGNLYAERPAYVFLIIYLLSFSLFLYILLDHLTNIRQYTAPLRLYASLFFLVFCFWAMKTLIIQLTGRLFNTAEQTREYEMNGFLINVFSGFLLTILLLPIVYSDTALFFYLTIALLIILFIYKLLKGFSIGISHAGFSLLHLFLYLCTLEILPYALLIRYYFDNIQG